LRRSNHAKAKSTRDPESASNAEFKCILQLVKGSIPLDATKWTCIVNNCCGVSEETTTGEQPPHRQLHLPRHQEKDLGIAAGELQVTPVQQLETVTLMLIAEPAKTCVQIVLACGVQWILNRHQALCQRRCHHLQCHQHQCHLQCHQRQFPALCQVIVLEDPWTIVLICAQPMYPLTLSKPASSVAKIVAPMR